MAHQYGALLYDPHNPDRPDDTALALERCKDLLSMVGGWAHLGNEYGGDMATFGIEGVSLAMMIVESTLDHILVQESGKCEQCRAIAKRREG